MSVAEGRRLAGSEQGGVRAEELHTNGRRDPIGLGTDRPLLGWVAVSANRGGAQTAWQVRVRRELQAPEPSASDSAGPAAPGRAGSEHGEVVWDSGRVDSAESVDVAYGGADLAPRSRYTWTVRLWDEEGSAGPWSEPASFETGLDSASDRAATWISAPWEEDLATRLPLDSVEPLRSLTRIWLPGATRIGLRARLRVAPGRAVIAAPLVLGGALVRSVWVDGRAVRLPEPADGVGADVPAGRSVDVAALLRRGEQAGPPRHSVLAVEAESPRGVPGGLLGRLEVLAEGAAAATLVTDTSWRVHPDPPAGWSAPDFDDEGWAFAEEVGRHGDPPWGREPLAHRPSPYLRRAFRLDGPVRRARLYSSACGVYHLSVNGTPVSDERLAPGWTDYHQRIAYRCDDVTALLGGGDNTLTAVIGDGWWAGNIASFGPFQYGTARCLWARLEIDLLDGRRAVVCSDETWEAAEGPIRYADLQNGEVCDTRYGDRLHGPPAGATGRWQPAVALPGPGGRLVPAEGPPIRVLHELTPVRVEPRADGSSIVDFGQNLVGWVSLVVRERRGTRVLVRHAEALDADGGLYVDNLRSARQTDELICSGDGDEVLEPLFSVHGFRYAEVSGISGPLDPGAIRARVAHADMEQIGEFSCSDPRLNRLQANIVWGARGNFLSVPTDCPQRDERLGWSGDAQVFARTAAFNYDTRRFFRKWLTDLTDAQRASGGVSFVAPHVINRDDATLSEEQRSSAGWGDAVVIVPAEQHRAFADRRAVELTYAAGCRWLAWLDEHSDGHLRPPVGFGDWLSLGPETPREVVATAFFARSAELLAGLADTLGWADDAAAHRARHAAVRAAFRRAFVRAGRVEGATQAAQVLALAFGLLDRAEIPAAVEVLVADIRARNGHLSTGFLATPYLLGVLADHGRLDVAYQLLLEESHPSWLYPIAHGATTMWERWDTWTEHGGFQDPHMNSLNHYAYGAVGAFLYEVVGGLVPAEPGYRRFVVHPRPGGGLRSARVAYRSVRGRIVVAWRAPGDGSLEVDTEVPVGCEAEVRLPGGAGRVLSEGGRALEEVAGVRVLSSGDGWVSLGVASGVYRFASRRGPGEPSPGTARRGGASTGVRGQLPA
jgi:alpha-L-rhamnosidase